MSTTIETLKNSNVGMLALSAVAFFFTAVLVFFIIRMLVGGRLRMPGGRTRQARLGIVDAFDLDRQRQLILVRRDNTEHLIMIGGPNDLLIEAEIVRVEARDLRRDKAPEFMGGPSDGRIPAPFVLPTERQDADAPAIDPAQASPAPQPEPQISPDFLLPITRADDLPLTSNAPGEQPAQRTPTFPLPPRRPPPPPERRVPPRPPEPPRAAGSRVEPLPIDVAPAPRPIVEVPAEPRIDAPVAIEVAAAESAPPPAPLVAPPAATPRATPPSFLKPLPPRPPIRPLVRSNPRPPSIGGEPATSVPVPAPPPPTGAAPPLPMAPPPTLPPLAEIPSVAPKPAAAAEPMMSEGDPKDALESLEEEMAKLLGRGPGT